MHTKDAATYAVGKIHTLNPTRNQQEREWMGGEDEKAYILVAAAGAKAVTLYDMLGVKTKTFTVANNSGATALPGAGHKIESGPTKDGPWFSKNTAAFNGLAFGTAAEVTFQDAARFWKITLTADAALDIPVTVYAHGNNF